jgi:hypothetical protein
MDHRQTRPSQDIFVGASPSVTAARSSTGADFGSRIFTAVDETVVGR